MKEMTMTENVEFTPEQQAKIDEIVKQRVSRERERLEKESGVEDLQRQLAAKDEEISQIRREHYRANARRAILDELGAHGVTEEGRIERILRHVDVDAIEPDKGGNPYFGSIRQQLASVSKDLPELLDYQLGGGSGPGSKKPVVQREAPLTHQELESMSESEINSRWDQIKAFMAGERG
jgi:hypothetical protein